MRTDLQINYYALELVYDKLGIYKTALENMDDALANLKTFLEQQESEAVSKILEKIEEVTISTGKKQDMITDMQFVLNGYITEMTKLVNANTPGVMTRVDPPDIKYNLDQIKSARDALQRKVNESVPTYYHPYYASDRETMAERDKLLRNYSKLEYFRVNQLVPFVNRVSEKISEMYDIYNNNLYYLEAMDDYYRERLDEVYSEHTSLSDKIENFVEKALDVALAFVLPIVIVGVMAAICIVYPPFGLIVKNAMVIGCASLVVMPDSIMPEALKEIRDDTIGRAVMLVTEGPKAVIEDIGQDFMDGIQTPEGIAGYAGDAVVSFAGLWYLKYRKVTGAKIGEVDDLARAGDVDDVAPGVKNKKADVGKVNTESGSDTVTYRRVQGGSGNNASQVRIEVNADGTIRIPNKDANLSISIDGGEHAEYFLNKRGGDAQIIEVDVPKWFDDFLQDNAIPQVNYKTNPLNQGGAAPKITDITTPGNCFELPAPWIEWLEEYGGNARIVNP